MDLIIVESPTKARTLSKFLGKKYAIEASMGHIRDLPKSKLGVDLNHDFAPQYETSKGKSAIIAKLKKLAKTASNIYLATDPDREGEAISFHIAHLIKSKTYHRVTFHEITASAINYALTHPGKINQHLVDAQQARRILDRLVGYHLSPLLWRKVRRGLSAGRVQSVALRLIVEREQEIKAFNPKEYWEIIAQLASVANPNAFVKAELIEVNNQKVAVQILLNSKTIVDPIIFDLKTAAYTVKTIDRKEMKKNPYPPFTTSTLQQAAANVLGWSGKQTMMIAQQLYEAGLITYHRTDSVNLAKEALLKVRTEIVKLYGEKYLPPTSITYVTKSKNAQEAHEAIRPTNVSLIDIMVEIKEATANHQKLYQLIYRRFLACQMASAIFDQTTILINASPARPQASYLFKASGSVIKFDGWKVVYNQAATKDELILPPLTEHEALNLLELIPTQKFTEPPPRFNDASVIKELEKRGIGRPSTYASILSTITDRGYVERIEKRYHPTSVGETVINFLITQFPGVMDYDFTAEMEEDLDRIARGEKPWQMVLKSFWQPFFKLYQTAEKNAPRAEIPVEKTGEACPKCHEGELVVRTGKFGKFMSCSRFPDCGYKASLRQVVEGVSCPQCQGEVLQKRTKTGRIFFGCANYPKCTYATWSDPSKTHSTL